MITTQHLLSQAPDNPELNIDSVIKMEVDVLDSLLLVPRVATNSLAHSLNKESVVIKEYLRSLIDTAENGLNSLKDYTVDDAWQYKFKGTNLELELSKYVAQINKLPIGDTEIEKFTNYIDRKSKIKPEIQEGKEIINRFPKESIIAFYKVQYIDIVNAEIFFLKDIILTK